MQLFQEFCFFVLFWFVLFLILLDNNTKIWDDIRCLSNKYGTFSYCWKHLWFVKHAFYEKGECWSIISKMAVIFRAIQCFCDYSKHVSWKIFSILSSKKQLQEILEAWDKSCFHRAFMLGILDKYEWSKDLVYSFHKLGEDHLSLYNSKGSLKVKFH